MCCHACKKAINFICKNSGLSHTICKSVYQCQPCLIHPLLKRKGNGSSRKYTKTLHEEGKSFLGGLRSAKRRRPCSPQFYCYIGFSLFVFLSKQWLCDINSRNGAVQSRRYHRRARIFDWGNPKHKSHAMASSEIFKK